MVLEDRKTGFCMLMVLLCIFAYYTFWVIILPFIDSDHFVHKYFLPQEHAILIPTFAGMAIFSFVMIFLGFIILTSKENMRSKESLR